LQTPIVITSISSPTSAVNAFAKIQGVKLIVVGDKKSPPIYECQNTTFLSVEAQKSLSYEFVNLLPYNHYCRKMIGYLYAIDNGATLIYETDDDNAPYPDWFIEPFEGDWLTTPSDRGFINIYRSFTSQHIWPRGFSLMRILDDTSTLRKEELKLQTHRVGIWQGLADGDPDVDAIYRLTNNVPCIFDKEDSIVLAEGTVCPFNSQNTVFKKEAFPLLYLPAFVTFRFTDILRGLVAQPVLWAMGYRLGFMRATVYQERNPHHYLKDFESEIPCYLQSENIIEWITTVVTSDASIEDNLHRAYVKLLQQKIIVEDEMNLLEAWLKSLQNV
jgi:hypothetical protein